MDERINKEFKKIWKKIEDLELKIIQPDKKSEIVSDKKTKLKYNFENKTLNHNKLLGWLLKSDFCHSKNGLSKAEVIDIFKQNGRPVVKKKIYDLLDVWKKRKKIEAIKEEGKLRYFWATNE